MGQRSRQASPSSSRVCQASQHLERRSHVVGINKRSAAAPSGGDAGLVPLGIGEHDEGRGVRVVDQVAACGQRRRDPVEGDLGCYPDVEVEPLPGLVVSLAALEPQGGLHPGQVAELLTHELTHCLMYQRSATADSWPYKGIPLWFREGMASVTAHQGYRRPHDEDIARYLK